MKWPALISMSLLGFLAPATTLACTCPQSPPGPCQSMQKGDVVFLGTVTKIENVPGAQPGASGNAIARYIFHIDELVAGPDAAEIGVFSGGDDGDCAYRFENGKQYLVFAQPETEGKLFTTLCSGTRPASEAHALLPQLRAAMKGERVASVFGVLRRANPPLLAPANDPDDPLPHVALKLRSKYDQFSTSTDAHGAYSIYDVHPGEYRFSAILPALLELTRKTLTGGLPPLKLAAGACTEYNVEALPTGRIRGSVLGPKGRPLPIASVELYRADRFDDSRAGLWAFQGSKGGFEFDHIGPGEYILVFNRLNRADPNSPYPRTFYPGAADLSHAIRIKLKDGRQLLHANVKLGAGYPTRQLRVRLLWPDGRPPGEIYVTAKADRGENPAMQKIADARYQFTLLKDSHYTISAWEDLDPQRQGARPAENGCTVPARIEAPPVVVDAADTQAIEITLTFATSKCSD
jgi:hypothetical protein